MSETDFYETVRRRADLDSEAAAREATEATIRTLGERLSEGAAADLAPGLPDSIADLLVDASQGGTADFSFDEFLDRVGDRIETGDVDPLLVARAVGATLADAVGDEALGDARPQLPPEFDRLFWALGHDEFVDLVRRHGDLDSDEAALEAAGATLGVLGERISQGQAADVAAYLPEEFAETLLAAGTPATDLSAEEFVDRVADLAGVGADVARTYVRATTAALAEAVPDYEYRDVLDQLPEAYGPLLGAVVGRDGADR